MCTVCGCGEGETKISGPHGHQHVHTHADGTTHSHAHDHGHAHGHGHPGHEHAHEHPQDHGGGTAHPHAHDHGHGHAHDHPHAHGDHIHDAGDVIHYGEGPARAHAPGLSQARMVEIETSILAKNDSFAARNRARLEESGILALNLLSGPGAGKTTLLVETLKALSGHIPAAVIEGDQQTQNDAERIRAVGVPAVQINTGKGCHLDAHMVGHALEKLPLPEGGMLFIENVGNLVCPAAFDLGEAARITLVSLTEGEDKPLKYPDIFESADVVLVTKTDLAPHLDADMALIERNIARVNPRAEILHVSARVEGGLAPWLSWLRKARAARLNRLADAVQAKADALRAAARPAAE